MSKTEEGREGGPASGICHWLRNCVYHHRLRILAGLVLLVVELLLYLNTDVMRENKTNYLTGEGSWGQTQGDDANSFTQVFVSEHARLSSLSFLMDMEGVTRRDGEVAILLSDEKDRILYEETLGFDRISDGVFTDVNVNLRLSAGHTYYLTLVTKPSSAGEYPAVGVCGKEYYLPENGMLIFGDEMPDIQLVSRYQYRVVPFSKARNIILLCVVTALGVMFGLPDNPWVRRVAGVVILAAAPYVLGGRLELLTYRELIYLPIALKWNVGIMYALEILVLLCTHSPRITIALTNICLTLLYSANYFVIIYRGTPLRVNDFSAAGTAFKVMGGYSFVPNAHLALAWGLLLMFVVFGVQTGVRKAGASSPERESAKKYWVRKLLSYAVTIAIAAAVAVYGGYQLIYTDLLERAGFEFEEALGFNQYVLYYFNGYLVATCIDLRNARVTPPEGYSAERAAKILEETMEGAKSQEISSEELPHVILILNESFSDLSILGDLEMNQENMGYFNALSENTVRGYVNVSVIGGGTANSEFEVLTGCNTAFFPASYYPYQQGIKRPINSLISRMKDNGYTTVSMHPERATNWNRDKVYQYYGFDESLWREDFAGAERIHNGVSDAETYRKVIELYENREEGEKLFVFDLTMQNHGDYPGESGPYEVQSGRMQNAMIDEYLTLVKISDGAFADLVGYFEEQDEKVIICMFGDHQPWLSELITGADGNGGSSDAKELMKMYKTPFVIWANYDIEEEDGYDISINYLGGLLQKTAGVPMSPYFMYLEKLREDYPIITVHGYVDNEGNYSNWSSTGDEFPEYRMLQYNYLFDKNIVDWGF